MSSTRAVLYIRDLPGGGFVSIEGESDQRGMGYVGALRVERRSECDRRDGHLPPIVLEATAPTQVEVFDRLVVVANSNVAVAAALLRWQAGQGEGGRMVT
ncbi:MAG TPA: hypothetical protein VGE02_14680 [Gemmatimonadales bacterium]